MSAHRPVLPIDQLLSPETFEIISEVLRERARAIIDFGHDAGADDALPLHTLGEKASTFLMIASERAAGSSERRILPGARTKAVQGIAIALAFLAAIDREMAREGA